MDPMKCRVKGKQIYMYRAMVQSLGAEPCYRALVQSLGTEPWYRSLVQSLGTDQRARTDEEAEEEIKVIGRLCGYRHDDYDTYIRVVSSFYISLTTAQ